ncbi:MAG: hypothetical protein HOO06_13665 [Bdellovibrionaceae bacterium]|jgi:hypothetical protein|nr:hypothetical protein [Pseudobdellovibrionaceae bacterium]
MQILKTIIVLSAVVLTVNACSSKSDSDKSVRDANRSIDESKKKADDAVKEAEKAGQATKDITASGGQPGSIAISGEIVKDESKAIDGLDPRVFLDVATGKGWRGSNPVLTASIILKGSLALEQKKQLNELKLGQFLNFGCDLSNNQVNGLTEKPLEPLVVTGSTSVQIVSAENIFVCDASLLQGQFLSLVSKRLFLSSMQIVITGLGQLSVIAESLSLEGQNLIKLEGEDGSATLLSGPSLNMNVKKLTGTGNLKINSNGSNYVEKVN